MKLLLDENVSHKLLADIEPMFPESTHVRNVGLAAAEDVVIWRYAKQQGFEIVSRDKDFFDLSVELGAPPHVLWLDLSNPSTELTRRTLRAISGQIQDMFERQGMACVRVARAGAKRA